MSDEEVSPASFAIRHFAGAVTRASDAVLALLQRPEYLGGEVDRMPSLELAVALPERRADGVDDDRGGHARSLARGPSPPTTGRTRRSR